MADFEMQRVLKLLEEIKSDNQKIAKHDTYLMILGAALVLLFPAVVTWNYQLKSQLEEIHSRTLILQERFRFYERSNPKFYVPGESSPQP